MIKRYREISIIYGGSGRRYAEALSQRINFLSENERYPLKATLILEEILTGELLTDVMNLFKESELCVAFLTADDCFENDGSNKKRLRQNVVFEIGMALIQLGRERCILLSDFDVRSKEFELPSDMNSLEIKYFDCNGLEELNEQIIRKILQFKEKNTNYENVLPYTNLLLREDYFVDYENIFSNRPLLLASEGKDFFKDTLNYWTKECEDFLYFDEKCIFLLERLGFLPVFGHIPEVFDFMDKTIVFMEDYKQVDIRYYKNIDLLNFVRNLVLCVIEYTRIKTVNNAPDIRYYENLLNSYLSEPYPDDISMNPLISVVYFDYLGLIYLKLYRGLKKEEYLQKALDNLKKASGYVGLVDMSLQIWSGFLTYNIARVYAEMNDSNNSDIYYRKAISIRSRWLKSTKYNITVRNALSYEYFIAKIHYIDMCRSFKLIPEEEIHHEYSGIESELNTYSDIDEKMDQLIYIRHLLTERKNLKD